VNPSLRSSSRLVCSMECEMTDGARGVRRRSVLAAAQRLT
jgi:hypothetical protein